MPECFYCGKETPTTEMVLVREYKSNTGTFWYFCNFWCLVKWLDRKLMVPGEGKK